MYKDKKICVVIPAYNEGSFIAQVIGNLPLFIDTIIVVDDNSKDNTASTVGEIDDSRVVLVKNVLNLGVGGATMEGYRRAIGLCADIVVKVDGDAQMPVCLLESLLNPIVDEGYDYAKGNRFLESNSLNQMPKMRLIGNIMLTFLTKLASGYWHIFDPQNGFTAIQASCLKTLDLDRVSKRYFFENDMLVNLNVQNARVKDVAMPAVYGKEESGIRIASVFLTFPFLLLRRFIGRVYQKYVLRDFSPIALFLGLGSLLLGWGVGFGIYLWIKSILTHVQTSTGTVMLAVLPLILGFQLVLEALVLDIHNSPK